MHSGIQIEMIARLPGAETVDKIPLIRDMDTPPVINNNHEAYI